MEKIVSLLLPIGLLLFVIYTVVNHYVELSDAVAYPWMIISVILELGGVFYNGRCLGLHKSPYEVWKKK